MHREEIPVFGVGDVFMTCRIVISMHLSLNLIEKHWNGLKSAINTINLELDILCPIRAGL